MFPDTCLLERGTYITSYMRFPGRGTHTTGDMCFPGKGTYITSDICFQGGKHSMIRDICFLGGGTYNTISDMCSRAGEHISLVIPVPG